MGADRLGRVPVTPASLRSQALGLGGENRVEPRSILGTLSEAATQFLDVVPETISWRIFSG